MLPTAFDNDGSLTDVLSSCLGAVGVTGARRDVRIADANAILLVVVDGLGVANLERARGHARFLHDPRHDHQKLRTVFPSTTAAAMSSLMTGVDPIRHGIVGYRIQNPQSGELFNQLNELDRAPDEWMRAPTLARTFSSSAEVIVVGRAKFEDSPLTRMIYDGATYVAAESIEDRFRVGLELVSTPGRVVVLYVSELDSLAHKFGVDSNRWTDALERVDSCLRDAARELAAGGVQAGTNGASIVVTADHGVVDVPATQHDVFSDPPLVEFVRDVGGEPRCLQLYVSQPEHVATVAERWREYVGGRADVVTRLDALEGGLFGADGAHQMSEIIDRIGDVLVCARDNIVFYDGRATNTAPQRMIGQHGAVSEVEMGVPLISIAPTN